ncbi:MAG: hypothetical protein AVDCRST_MAG70-1234 [uncultured Thermomicrobiales bacterium]|uniref:Uncharacterized protein n=1 Tax=uncultured Thermomicrobiales bacterium TaxID=1645740 RepID=A0A6J4UMX8_9BACT|nr:MAG: hypothetical protein AVDCRST_MAG70-1234 [uncultured Thermomicrobiales bacterium]
MSRQSSSPSDRLANLSRPGRGRSLAIAATLVAGLLAACGDEEQIDPVSVAPTLTPISIIGGDPPLTTVDLASPDAATPIGASPVAGSPSAGSPVAGTPVAGPAVASPEASPVAADPADVGSLVARANAAWAGIRSYRAVEVSGQTGTVPVDTAVTPGASPVAAAGEVLIVDEVVFPDSRHQTISEGGVGSEVIASGGLLYMRGALAATFVDPAVGLSSWVIVDPARVPPESPLGTFVSRFVGAEATAFTAPFGIPSAETASLPVRSLGPVTSGVRSCVAYEVVQTTQIGERIEIVLAIDEAGLACYQETRAGTITNRVTFSDFDADIAIVAPAGAVPAANFGPLNVPAASPAASPTS